MSGYVCANCHSWIAPEFTTCPECGTDLVFSGDNLNVIDRIQPDCLIYRYDGSDKLEPAVLIKKGKSNDKVATQLKEYSKPVTVPQNQVFHFDQSIYSSIQSLRNERMAAMKRFDQMIQLHWQKLKRYHV